MSSPPILHDLAAGLIDPIPMTWGPIDAWTGR